MIISSKQSAAFNHFCIIFFSRSFCLSYNSSYLISISKDFRVSYKSCALSNIAELESLYIGSNIIETKPLFNTLPSSVTEFFVHFLTVGSKYHSPHNLPIILSTLTPNLCEYILANCLKVKAQPISPDPNATFPFDGSIVKSPIDPSS
mmetsp:Transcript_8670/g.1203  ORF Transcript_8670/g.1203 Transcript_8670/m.1203 type:complete len:148 (+) Transcript_8670:1540-1983(+)